MPWKVDWQVHINGNDVSGNMRDYLTDIDVTDKAGSASDSCSLSFDDSDGQLRLPEKVAKVRVTLQGVQVFSGTVGDIKSSGSRGSGRKLTVNAKGMDERGKVKEPLSYHHDDGTMQDFLNKGAKHAGLTGIKIHPDLAKIKRDYWVADGESFIAVGQKLAREHHATFKIRAGQGGKDEAILVPRGKDHGLPTVTGSYGVNLISWDITPTSSRRVFTSAKTKYFDRKEATFKSETIDFGLSGALPKSVNAMRAAVFDKDQAKASGEARKGEADREGGEGSVELDLCVEAQAEGKFILTGARSGVDGTYLIDGVHHKASRSSGATTSLDLKHPQGGAGQDNR